MKIRTKVGPKFLYDGGDDELKQGNFGELAMSQVMAPLSELSIRGSIYTAAVSGVTSTVGLATTYTGLVISNTPGSNIIMVPLYVGYAQSVINAAVSAIGILAGYHATTPVTHTTPVTPTAQRIGGPAGNIGLADSSATLPVAPTWRAFFNSTPTATTNLPGMEIECKGRWTILPGGFFGTGTVAASPASALHIAITWAELPILP